MPLNSAHYFTAIQPTPRINHPRHPRPIIFLELSASGCTPWLCLCLWFNECEFYVLAVGALDKFTNVSFLHLNDIPRQTGIRTRPSCLRCLRFVASQLRDPVVRQRK